MRSCSRHYRLAVRIVSGRDAVPVVTQILRQPENKHAGISRRKRAVLPHLGNFFISNIYEAITGNRRLPKALLKRAVANGLSREHLDAVYRQARSPEELPALLLRIADDRLHKALYWDEIGVKNRARENFFESTLWDLYASCLINDPGARSRIIERFSSSYATAAPHFANPAEPIDIPYLSTSIKGYLRVPSLQPKPAAEAEAEPCINVNHPCVILFNGIGSPKEELHLTENALLAIGAATMSFDYPSGGFEDATQGSLGFDTEELANSLFLYLASRIDIDTSRVALLGLSVGGRLALYAALRQPERFRAIATLSAPYEMLADLDLLLPVMKREYAVAPGCTKASIFEMAKCTPLRGQLINLTSSVLVIGGGKDLIAMPEETRTIYDQCGSSDKKLIVCPAAGHNCNEMMPSLRHEIAQWLRQRL
jgi:pimeloyl-ACP methyl ester carboxylesterase